MDFTHRCVTQALVAVVGLSSAPNIQACDCLNPFRLTPSEHLETMDVVFRGITLDRIVFDSTAYYTFEVIEMWKGEPPTATTMQVTSGRDQANCGIKFEIGEQYLVYAWTIRDEVRTGSCTRTSFYRPSEGEALGGPIWTNFLPTEFRRGDVNADGRLTIGDPIASLTHQFIGGVDPECLDALDLDDDGTIAISDPVLNLTYQFIGGVKPAAPFAECGVDVSADDLTCRRFSPCEVPHEFNTIESIRSIRRFGLDWVIMEFHSERAFEPVDDEFALGIGSDWFNLIFLEDGTFVNAWTIAPDDPERISFTIATDRFNQLLHHSPVTILSASTPTREDEWDFGLFDKWRLIE